MFSRRFIIETINEQMKNISQVEHLRYRCPNAFMLNLLAGLVTCCLKDNKLTLNLTDIERNSMNIAQAVLKLVTMWHCSINYFL